jgi:hypothetical protein
MSTGSTGVRRRNFLAARAALGLLSFGFTAPGHGTGWSPLRARRSRCIRSLPYPFAAAM